MRRFAAFTVLVYLIPTSLPTARAQSFSSIAAANINIVQNDVNNDETSVAVTTPLLLRNFQVLSGVGSGTNRGDTTIRVGDDGSTNFANGVFMTSVRQNGRDNSVAPNVGGNTGGAATGLEYASTAIERGATNMFIPTFHASSGNEFNTNLAAGYFPYASGWIGGHARNIVNGNGGGIAAADSSFSPGLTLGTHFVDNANGVFQLNINPLTGNNASQNGVLLVTGGKNEDNYALSRANANGSFELYVRDNGSSGTGTEQDGVAFVYVPANTPGVTSGRLRGDATAVAGVSSGSFTTAPDGTGRILLTIPGITQEHQGVLLISAEGGETNNFDNVVSYQWDQARSGWVIEGRDIINTTTIPALEGVGTEGMVSFVFVPVPEPTTILGLVAGAGLLLGGVRKWRRPVGPAGPGLAFAV